MGSRSSPNGQKCAVPPPGEHRTHRRRSGHVRRAQPSAARSPDLAAVAREAVANFLRDESAATDGESAATDGRDATARRDDTTAPETAPDATAAGVAVAGSARREGARESEGPLAVAGEEAIRGAANAAGQFAAQDVALRAAAISVATLDRIESAAAKLETDIAAALTEQAELHAGAGRAAENAVRAAQAASTSAGTAEEASGRAKALARRAGRYVSIAVVLLLIQVLVIVLFASSAH